MLAGYCVEDMLRYRQKWLWWKGEFWLCCGDDTYVKESKCWQVIVSKSCFEIARRVMVEGFLGLLLCDISAFGEGWFNPAMLGSSDGAAEQSWRTSDYSVSYHG